MNSCNFHFYRLEHEIQQLKQKICEVDGVQKGHFGTLEGKAASSSLPSNSEKSHLVPLMDARYWTFLMLFNKSLSLLLASLHMQGSIEGDK